MQLSPIALAVAAMIATTVPHSGSGGTAGRSRNLAAENHESPFACNLEAFTPEQRRRHFEELGPWLRDHKRGVRQLKNGYAFQFAADAATFDRVTEWAIQERACCPFFDIELKLEREGGPLWLVLSGRPGTKSFIRAEAAEWIGS